MTLRCLYCDFITNSLSELLDHEEDKHGKMIEALEGVDGNEEEEGEPITGEETEEE